MTSTPLASALMHLSLRCMYSLSFEVGEAQVMQKLAAWTEWLKVSVGGIRVNLMG